MLSPAQFRTSGTCGSTLGGFEHARSRSTPLRSKGAAARRTARTAANAAYPSFVPREVEEITEQAALDMAASMKRTALEVPSRGRAFDSAYVDAVDRPSGLDLPPVCMLHGFDSSSLEFRRLHPLLSESMPTYCLDLLGWGFNDQTVFSADQDLVIGPEQRTEHLYAFWREHIKEPMVLLGASLGGATAIDFALAHPEAVAGLVLVDAQGFIDGIGPMSSAPRFLLNLGVQVLKAEWLRESANQMAYFDKENMATPDARRVGRLHTFAEGWADANIAWMRSGGYSLSARIPEVSVPTLVMWGENDEILEPKTAEQFREALPDAEIVIVPECGHCAHLEQPTKAAELVTAFAARVRVPEAV